MKRLLKNKKGMTLLEVILALTLLAIFTVPLSIGFMNTLLMSRIIDRQNNVNAVSRVVKEQVKNALLDGMELTYLDGNEFDIIDFIRSNINGNGESDPIEIKYSNENEKTDYVFFYRVIYNHDQCYDDQYKNVYHVIIAIDLIDRNVSKNDNTDILNAIANRKYSNVNIFKVGANIGEEL